MRWLRYSVTRTCLAVAGLTLAAGALPAQSTGTIRGRVTEAGGGRPISDVQVTVSGTSLGAVSNASGDFVISGVPSAAVELGARRIGYQRRTLTVTVPAGSEVRVDIALNQTASQLDAIVVTGTAGEAERRTIGNAVTQLNVAEINERTAVVNVTEVLQSRTPGLTLLPGSGTPGAAAEFRIRGAGSLVGYKPVVFVDGVRYNIEGLGNFNPTGTMGGTGGQAQSTQVTSALNLVSPEDIESVEVIKGPAAATLYGAEAANGVIQIITKRGRRGQQATRYRASIERGNQRIGASMQKNYTTCDAAKLAAPASWPGCQGLAVGTVVTQDPFKDDPNVLRVGDLAKYNVTVRGGAERYAYFLGATRDETQGIFQNSYDNRNSGRANFDLAPNSKTDVGVSIGFQQGHLRLPLADESAVSIPFGAARGRPLACSARADSICYTIGNPITANRYNNQTRSQRITIGSTMNYRPFDWLRNRLTLGLDNTSSTAEVLSLPLESPDEPLGVFNQRVPRSTIYTIDYVGNVEYAVKSWLTTTTSIGTQIVSNKTESLFGQGVGLGAPTVTVIGSATLKNSDNSYTEQNSLGYYVQEQIGWNNRLFLTGAVRADDNSSFGTNFDWIVYPKVSLSYVLTEEPRVASYLQQMRLNSLKLRGAWGQAGRAPNPYSATQTYTVSTVTLGTTSASALRTSAFGNPDLKPERGEEYELGFEASALGDRLGVDFTYYNKKTTDLLVARPVAPSLGFNSSPQTNFGSISNRGIEVVLSATPVARQVFSWDSRVTYAANRNRLLSVPDTTTAKTISGQAYGVAQENHIGYPLGGYWIQKPLRDASGAYILTPARAIAMDSSCTAAGCTLNKTYIGSPAPLREIGFSNTFTIFKNFTVYALLDYKGGHYLFNARERQRCINGLNCEFINTPGRDTIEIKAWRQATNFDPYIEKADFVKLRDLSFSFAIPRRYLQYFRGEDASIVVAGHDLAVWSDYSGPDPEVNSYGGRLFGRADVYTMPMLRRWTFGLNLGF